MRSDTLACRSKVATTGTSGPTIAAHQLEQHALRVVLLGRHRRAVGADIDAVDRQGGNQPALDRVEQLLEELVLDRAVRLAHRQRDADRLPRTGRVHRRDKAGRLRQHRRGGAARLGDDVVAFEIGAREKMRLGRGRREFVALDREAEDRDAGIAGGIWRGRAWRSAGPWLRGASLGRPDDRAQPGGFP